MDVKEITKVIDAKNFDIHKFIDEMISKKDRYVNIYIGEYGTSISIYPLDVYGDDDLK